MACLMMACVLLVGAREVRGQSVTAVPQFDLNRFTGTWYEMARLPNGREKECVSDVFELIALGDKPHTFQVVLSCMTKGGYTDARNANGKPQDKKSPDGRLKVSYLWPFSSKYWVLALGPKYEWALVGNPNHKELWLLSRTKTMMPEVLAEVEAKAAAEGFPVGKMVVVRQGRR
jgi:apolipoprotein D and lipocalin family protein